MPDAVNNKCWQNELFALAEGDIGSFLASASQKNTKELDQQTHNTFLIYCAKCNVLETVTITKEAMNEIINTITSMKSNCGWR